MAEPRSRPERRAVTATMVRRLSCTISVSPGFVWIDASSPRSAWPPDPTRTGTRARTSAPDRPGGRGITARTRQARAPRTISPTSAPDTAGVAASASSEAPMPSRAAASFGAIVTVGPLTTMPLFRSTTPCTFWSSAATSPAFARATVRSSLKTRTSIGCGVVVRSPITSSTSCPISTSSAGCVFSILPRRSSAISSALRRCPIFRRRA